MSDVFSDRLLDRRKQLEALIQEQADKIPDIEAFSALAKKYNVNTKELDELLTIAKAVFKAAKVKIPAPEK